MAGKEDTSSDFLQPLPVEKWPLLRDTLKRDWPCFAYYYYWVNNSIKWIEKQPDLKLNIYCPYGKYEFGVFIGISTYAMYMVVPFAYHESKLILRDCLIKTNRIDWTEGVIFAAVHEYFEVAVIDAIESLEKSIGLHVEDIGPSNYYFKPKEECSSVEISVPDGFELKLLQETDIPFIHHLWPREEVKKNPVKSINFLATMVRLNRGIGLFNQNDNKLISWALQSEWGGLGNVQTLDEYKRRGFAKVVVNALSKILAEEGLDTILFVVAGNESSEKLFTSLGWKRVNSETYTVMKPISL